MDIAVRTDKSSGLNIYIGTFLIAFSTLALEITLSRLLSVIVWYHLAFFAISTAMLGMTAGAVTVYLKPKWFTAEKLSVSLAKMCLAYSVSVPVSLLFLCLVQVGIGSSNMRYPALLIITFACALPFYFSGVVVSAVLTKSKLSIGKLYASDLIGASLGCLFVLGGLEYFDAPSLVILCGTVGILCVFSYAYKFKSLQLKLTSTVILILFAAVISLNMSTTNGIRPVYVKGNSEDPSQFVYEKWNSFSRVGVYLPTIGNPNWKSSPVAPVDSTCTFYWMKIDGDAGTPLVKQKNGETLSLLRYDITNVAYYLKEGGKSACIIGIGGGKDLQSALLFGMKDITGVEVNPIFVDLQQNKFRDETNIVNNPNVNLVVDEARSYMSRSDRKFSLIQMSLIDTWASTGAGAFSLTENSLYTVEAWKVMLEHLDENGIFTVSRWFSPNNPGETGRMVSLAVSTLLQLGTKDPSKHIAMLSIEGIATMIVSKVPFSDSDIGTIRLVSHNLKFDPAIIPGESPANNTLREIVSVKSDDELSQAIKDKPLNYSPPTDNDPYFFNMLLFSHLKEANAHGNGVLKGNLKASITLAALVLSLLILSAITVLFPLLNGSMKSNTGVNSKKIFWKGAFYFSLIGAGFMMIEIGLIQRLSVFLGHPVYALGILLFTIILSAGTGSFFSEYLNLTSKNRRFILPCLAAIMIISVKFILDFVISNMVASPEINKIVVSVLVIFPLGFVLGFFFPMGMKLVKSASEVQTPWFWALNGIFGVLFSALAVFISIYSGISTNFYLASLCYASIILIISGLSKAAGTNTIPKLR